MGIYDERGQIFNGTCRIVLELAPVNYNCYMPMD